MRRGGQKRALNSLELQEVVSCSMWERPGTKARSSTGAAHALKTTVFLAPHICTFMLGGQHRISILYRWWPQPHSPHGLPASVCQGLGIAGRCYHAPANTYLFTEHPPRWRMTNTSTRKHYICPVGAFCIYVFVGACVYTRVCTCRNKRTTLGPVLCSVMCTVDLI